MTIFAAFLASSEAESKTTYYLQLSQLNGHTVPSQQVVDRFLDILSNDTNGGNNDEEQVSHDVNTMALWLEVQYVSPSESSIATEGQFKEFYYRESLASQLTEHSFQSTEKTSPGKDDALASSSPQATISPSSIMPEKRSIFEVEVQRSPASEACSSGPMSEHVSIVLSDTPNTPTESNMEITGSTVISEGEFCRVSLLDERIFPSVKISHSESDGATVAQCMAPSDLCQSNRISDATEFTIPCPTGENEDKLVVRESSLIEIAIDTSVIDSGFVHPQTDGLEDLIIVSSSSNMLELIEDDHQIQNLLQDLECTELEHEVEIPAVECQKETSSFYRINDESVVLSSTHLVQNEACESSADAAPESFTNLTCESPVDLECSLKALTIEDNMITSESIPKPEPTSGSVSTIGTKSPSYLRSLKENLGCSII